jgi:peptide-methionine (S)-S-oxide reductase
MSDNAETAILAGGCSWIMQQLLRHPDGVISTRVGWTGGEGDNPTEENPQGHAEAVEVVFDPERLSYRDLLEYFFQVHWLGKTVTEISEAGRFWEDPAENQAYFQRFPDYPEGSKPPFPRRGVEAANRETVA